MEWAYVLAIVLPVMLAVIIGIFYNSRRIDDLRSDMNERFGEVNQRFADINQTMNQRFSEVNQRLADMREEMREIRMILMEFLKKEVGV